MSAVSQSDDRPDRDSGVAVEHAVVVQSSRVPGSFSHIRLGGASSDVWLACPGGVPDAGVLRAYRRVMVDAHGAGLVGNRLVDGRTPPPLDEWGSENPSRIGESIRGSLTLTLLGSDDGSVRTAWVLPDSLGSGLVWLYKGAGVTAVSSDLRSLRSVLASIGVIVNKSAAHVASMIATGSGLTGASWAGIRALPVAHFVEASEIGIRVSKYTGVGFDAIEESPEETVDRAWQDALHNVRVLADANISGRRIAHLTGGSDSRAVLAAILSSNLADRFAFACGGSRLEPDKRISLLLCEHFGLVATDYLGVDRDLAFDTFEEATLSEFAVTDGMLAGAADQGLRRSGNLLAGGTYGEHLKIFFPSPAQGVSPEVWLSSYYSERILGSEPAQRLMSEAAFEAIRDEFTQAWNEASQLEVPRENWGDYVFLTRRNRFFLGETIRATSTYTPRVDPLYSPAFMPYVASSSHVRRATGQVILSFIARGGAELAQLPFDKPQVQKLYLAARGLERLPLRENPAPWTLSRPQGQTDPASSWLPAQTSGDVAEALKRKMPISHVSTYRLVRPRLERLLRSRRDECSEILNVDLALDFLSRTPGHRSLYRTLTNAYRSLLWYFDDSDRSQAAVSVGS